MQDESQVDLTNINVRMRVMILNRLAEISKFANPFVMQDTQKLILKLIDSINNDISSLEERPVIDLMKALSKMLTQQHLQAGVQAQARELFKRVHNVVSDMAIENQDLVDTNFIIDYLNSINTHKRMLENEKTESFLGMFRAKCQEEETEQYIVEYLNNIGASLDLC